VHFVDVVATTCTQCTRPKEQTSDPPTIKTTWCRKPYAATQGLMLLMMGETPETCRAKENINKLLLLHQVGSAHYLLHLRTTFLMVITFAKSSA
jgi:hypothetical protein